MQIKLIKDFLKSQGWKYTKIQKKNVILFGISSNNNEFQCVADILEEEKIFLFFSYCNVFTPENKRGEMLSLLNELNCNFLSGNFIMNSENGEVSFRTSLPFLHIDFSLELVGQIILSNIYVMDKIMPFLVGLMLDEYTAEEAAQLSFSELR